MARGSDVFPEICRKVLVSHLEEALEDLRRHVLWKRDVPIGRPGALTLIYPLAYLYSIRFADNIYFGDRRVLEAAVEVGEFLCACMGPERRDEYRAFAARLGAVEDWVILFWLDAWELLRPHLPARTLRRWRRAMIPRLTDYAHRLAGYLQQERFTSASFNTSPNHAASYAADLLTAGMVLARPRWIELAEAFMDRFVAYQVEAGYWPEGHGPVCGYQAVSLAAVARFWALRPKAAYRRALQRAVDYHQTISYPDFTFVALVDRRQRYRDGVFIWGLGGLTVTPRGRAFVRAALEAALRAPSQFFWARLLENYRFLKRGPTPPYTPWTGHRWLENHSCFFREAGWQYNLSVNPVVVNPRSPFRLDYQSLLSVWHESVGLIVPGSQDKHRPWHGTFYAPGAEKLGVLHGGRIGNLCRPRYLEAFYSNGFTGRVEMSLAAPRTLVLTARQVGRRHWADVRLNVPLRVGVGAVVKVGSASHVLGRRKLALHAPARAKVTIFDGRVTIVSSADGTLHFPCLPWNPYTDSNRSSLREAFLRLEVPVPARPDGVRVRIAVR